MPYSKVEVAQVWSTIEENAWVSNTQNEGRKLHFTRKNNRKFEKDIAIEHIYEIMVMSI